MADLIGQPDRGIGAIERNQLVRGVAIFDWDHLQSFLVVARERSLSSAARTLGVTQSTMSRRLEAFHARSATQLLHKTSTGYVLTPVGQRVFASAERMEAEVLAIERSVAGQDDRIAGEVRVTAVESLGGDVLAPMLARLAARRPALQIELITDQRSLSLARREADIAVRMAAFDQHETLVKRVAGIAIGLFASRDYLASHGSPDLDVGAPGHFVVTAQRDLANQAEQLRLTEIAAAAVVAFRATNRHAQRAAVMAGVGIALLPLYMVESGDDLVELAMPSGRLEREVWLGIHRDTAQSKRIRTVADHLTAELKLWDHRFARPGNANLARSA